ncbi:13757_t:CDS:2 [Ambispora leptoticha]|uniref:13757_t:CDS:1 n=1 Tax=Ambispora leptoticha TaxID=144679 RepID=A0A9N8VSV2_9GLOM|nr:13757_t:CDS:2 [Ambispora leptoticha]
MSVFKIADILSDIFINLETPDLFSCALVSRLWCPIAIRLLWRDPFSGQIRKHQQCLKIFSLFLDEIQRSAIGISDLYLYSQFNKQIFDYPSFVTTINYGNLIAAIEPVFFLPLRREFDLSVAKTILEAFLDLFVVKGGVGRMRGIILNSTTRRFRTREYSFFAQPKYESLLKPLTRLELAIRLPKNEILTILTKYCTRIQHFEIWMFDNSPNRIIESAEKLANFIKLQQNLISLKVVNLDNGASYVMHALSYQENSLQTLELVNVNFTECPPWHELAACHNLQQLKLENIKKITRVMVQPLLEAEFPRLKVVNYGFLWPQSQDATLKEWVLSRNEKIYQDTFGISN